MAKQVKMSAAKPHDPNSMPEIHMVKKNQLLLVILWFSYLCQGMSASLATPENKQHVKKIKT